MQLILNKRTKNILLLQVAQYQKTSSKKRAKSLSLAFLPKENVLRIVVWHIIWRMEQKWKTFWDLCRWSTCGQNEKKNHWKWPKAYGILSPKLFWPPLRKNCSSDPEIILKFEAEGREFAKFLRSLEHFF